MLRRGLISCTILGIFTLMSGCSLIDKERGGRGRRSSRGEKNVKKEKKWINNVSIVSKKNRDFEYCSTIWRSLRGEEYVLNRVAEGLEQRYVLGVDSGQNFSGVYAAIALGESLKNFMGHATLTVKYIIYHSLNPKIVTFPLVEKNVADDRQMLIRLDPSPRLRKKIIAWQVTISDEGRQKEQVKSSYVWKKLAPKAMSKATSDPSQTGDAGIRH